MISNGTALKTIMLALDDPNDEMLVVLALQQLDLDCDVLLVPDGELVVEYFLSTQRGRRLRRSSHRPPDLVLADLALPKLDGLKVLRQLRWMARTDLSQLPPIILMSDTNDDSLAAMCYHYGASGFLWKGAPVQPFVEMVQQVVRYWLFTTVRPGPDTRPAPYGSLDSWLRAAVRNCTTESSPCKSTPATVADEPGPPVPPEF